jgi:IS4 transposase
MFLLLSESSLLAASVICMLNSFIFSDSSCKAYRTEKRFFSRESSISFPTLVCLLLSNLSNSLSVELFNLLKANGLPSFTKSAFSQRRYQLSYKIFPKMNALLVDLFYGSTASVVAHWEGFRLCAIDGSSLVLPQTPSTKKEFGVHRNGNRQKSGLHETVMARLLVHYDVLNHLITYSELHPIAKSELSIVYQWIETLLANSLTLFDRGFGSFALFYLMQKYDKAFVVRLKLNFNTVVSSFVKSGQSEAIVSFVNNKKQVIAGVTIPKGSTIQLRLIRVLLPDGTVEILGTSLIDNTKFPAEIFKELYRLRWGIETCFDRFKNKLLALCFIGHKADAIYQEVYANILVHNIHQLLVTPAQIIVNQKVQDNTNSGFIYKYDQKVNDNVTIGILRPQLFTLFFNPQSNDNINALIQSWAKYTEPIRPNRTNKRIKSLAKRRNLTTQTNYRRAG